MKKLIIIIGLMIALAGMVCAADINTIFLSAAAGAGNNTWDSDATVTFEYNVTGNFSSYNCYEISNRSGTYTMDYIYPANHTIENNTNSNFTLASLSDRDIQWTMGCNSSDNATLRYPAVAGDNDGTLTGATGWASHMLWIVKVDDTDPTVTVNDPSDLEWRTSAKGNTFNITATDTNSNTCWLETNLNESTNTSCSTWNSKSGGTDGYVSSWTTATSANLSWGTDNAWADTYSEGNYSWNIICNDSAGNIGYLSSNVSFLVDTVAPTMPNITYIYVGNAVSTLSSGSGNTGWLAAGNGSKSTDYTPKINWTTVTEKNFTKYWIRFDNDSNFASPEYNINITNKSLDWYVIGSGLSGDIDYYINITAFDEAGNTASSDAVLGWVYRTDSTCHTLKTGWNICSHIRTTNSSAASIINETGADYVAKYNSSDHTFITHVSGAAVNAQEQFDATIDGPTPALGDKEVMFLYVSSDTTWEHQLWDAAASYSYYNFTNVSNEGWNIVPWFDQVATTLGELDYSLNGNYTDDNVGGIAVNIQVINATNIQWFSMYVEENSTNKYVDLISNWTTNEDMAVDYGDAAWLWYDGKRATYQWNSSGEI